MTVKRGSLRSNWASTSPPIPAPMMATRSGGDEVVECSDQDMAGEKGREEGDILDGKKF